MCSASMWPSDRRLYRGFHREDALEEYGAMDYTTVVAHSQRAGPCCSISRLIQAVLLAKSGWSRERMS